MGTALIVIAVLLVIALALGAAYYYYRETKRREHLRDKFGPEYERTVSESGRSHAERELQQREERVSKLDIRELEPGERREFSERWKSVQAEFVDSPETAIIKADDLLQEVMRVRGYPVADFEQRAADLSVEHAAFVENYRKGHAISEAHRESPRSTEELRQGMIHYRALFSDLLGEVATRSNAR